MDELIKRLQAAHYHLRELDGRIWAEIDQRDVRREGDRLLARSRRPFQSDECLVGEFTSTGFLTSRGHHPEIPHYTKSVDDALRLVPKNFQWWVEATTEGGRAGVGQLRLGWKEVDAHTPILALCIAALQARADTNYARVYYSRRTGVNKWSGWK